MDRLWWWGYAVWLLAGLADFQCHRRSQLPVTSGLAEAGLHGVQIAMVGLAVVLALAFQPSWSLIGVLGLLLLGHTFAGYMDTRTAYGRREITPWEQHVHSVLDIAPWIAFAAYAVNHARLVDAGGLAMALRARALPGELWAAVLLPAIVCCAIPAANEIRQSIMASAQKRAAQ